MDPEELLSRKLEKKRRQLHRVTKALAAEDFYLLVDAYRRAVLTNRPKKDQRDHWDRVFNYLTVSSVHAKTI